MGSSRLEPQPTFISHHTIRGGRGCPIGVHGRVGGPIGFGLKNGYGKSPRAPAAAAGVPGSCRWVVAASCGCSIASVRALLELPAGDPDALAGSALTGSAEPGPECPHPKVVTHRTEWLATPLRAGARIAPHTARTSMAASAIMPTYSSVAVPPSPAAHGSRPLRGLNRCDHMPLIVALQPCSAEGRQDPGQGPHCAQRAPGGFSDAARASSAGRVSRATRPAAVRPRATARSAGTARRSPATRRSPRRSTAS